MSIRSNHSSRDFSPGFTLLEVMVAFSLLAILLTVIIQSQGETAFFLEKTRKLSLVQKEVINQLSKSERLYSGESIENAEGVYPEDHLLAGDRWQREVTQEDFMGIVPVMKITYRVFWKPDGRSEEQSFDASILGEVR